MLVVDHNTYFTQWQIGDTLHPMEYAGDVVVTFDPSKTNMAMVIGTPDGTILNTIEFSGNNRKRGPAMDTTLYCEEVRQFLKIYLSKVNLYLVAVEQAITKQGVNYHHSNMVLTEIRSNILNFFLEEYGLHVIEVNNWSWKFGILPEGYRSKYEKGSKKWFTKCMPDSPYSQYFEADMTDCICIYWYVIKNNCASYSCYCNQAEKCDMEHMHFYVASTNNVIEGMKEVTFNPRFSLQENLNYYLNRIIGHFYMTIPTDVIDIEDIYGHAVGFCLGDIGKDDLKVVARRT